MVHAEMRTFLTVRTEDIRVFHDKQIWQICRIWQKYNAIFNDKYTLKFKGKGYLMFPYSLDCVHFTKSLTHSIASWKTRVEKLASIQEGRYYLLKLKGPTYNLILLMTSESDFGHTHTNGNSKCLYHRHKTLWLEN